MNSYISMSELCYISMLAFTHANSICENSKVYRNKKGYFVVELPNYDYNSAEEKPRVIEKFESPIKIRHVETIVVK